MSINRFLFPLLLIALMPTYMLAQDAPPKNAPKAFYPLQVGNQWHYRMNGRTVATKVAEKTVINKLTCYRLDTNLGKKTIQEYVCEKADGVYRVRVGKEAVIKPPMLMLKLPFKKTATWKVNSSTSQAIFVGEFQATKDTITVPAGEFPCIKVTSKNFYMLGNEVDVTTWYAQDVGMVKQRVIYSGVEVISELTKYSFPKQTP